MILGGVDGKFNILPVREVVYLYASLCFDALNVLATLTHMPRPRYLQAS